MRDAVVFPHSVVVGLDHSKVMQGGMLEIITQHHLTLVTWGFVIISSLHCIKNYGFRKACQSQNDVTGVFDSVNSLRILLSVRRSGPVSTSTEAKPGWNM